MSRNSLFSLGLSYPSEGADLCIQKALVARPGSVHPKTIFRLIWSNKCLQALKAWKEGRKEVPHIIICKLYIGPTEWSPLLPIAAFNERHIGFILSASP